MLAYVFWHRPAEDVDREDYETRLRAFHQTVDASSACFAVDRLPWKDLDGYEDWYLVEHWAALGVLNATAVNAEHDAAAAGSAAGWGGVYALVRGAAEVPAGGRWSHDDDVSAETSWRRQLVLGPAPQFCVSGQPEGRRRVF